MSRVSQPDGQLDDDDFAHDAEEERWEIVLETQSGENPFTTEAQKGRKDGIQVFVVLDRLQGRF